MVYWKECNVIAIERDDAGDNKETRLTQRNGQGILPSGIELYLSGSGGRLKVEAQSSSQYLVVQHTLNLQSPFQVQRNIDICP